MLNFRYIFIIALFVFIKGNFLFSQETTDSTKKSEVKLFEPLKKHGSLFILQNNAHQFINKTQIQENDYLDYADVLIQQTNFYPLHLSSLGLANNVSFAAAYNNQFLVNGINLSDPISLNTNLSQYSPEYTENIEIYTGSIASIFSENATSTLINAPEINYNTNKPFFRFWGADAGEDYLALDGIFAQNIAPNLAFNFGIRSVNGKVVYTNDQVRSRGLRSGLRWNFAENQNISIIWMHNNHYLDEYGGISENSIDTKGNFIDDPISAISRFENNSKRNVKNDIIVNYTNILQNKSEAISSQAYLSDNFNYDYKNETLFSNTFYHNRITYYTRKLGLNFSYEKEISNLYLKTKFDINNSFIENNLYTYFPGNYNKLNYSAIAFIKYQISDISISGGYRLSNINSQTTHNIGAKITKDLGNYNFLILDYSQSQVLPIIPFSDLKTENNKLLYLRYINKSALFNIDFDLYYRNISQSISYEIDKNNKLIAKNLEGLNTYYGSNLNINFRWFKSEKYFDYEIYSNIKTNININSNANQNRLPLLNSFLDTYISIPKGRSRADIGFRISYLSETKGLTQFPDLNIYINNDFVNQNGLARNEAYVKLRLGQAYLKVSLINFLNRNYYYVPMYNALPSNFRITFNWTLI